MITKYAVLNPLDGQYIKASTKEEAYSIVVQNILTFYKNHVHSTPITEIQVAENGDETWLVVDNGTELPVEYINQLKANIIK